MIRTKWDEFKIHRQGDIINHPGDYAEENFKIILCIPFVDNFETRFDKKSQIYAEVLLLQFLPGYVLYMSVKKGCKLVK